MKSISTLFFQKIVFLIILAFASTSNAHAQDWKTERKAAVIFGLSQPLLAKGFNIEGNYIHHRLIFDYSHGVSLEFTDDLLTPELKDQGVVIHVPWTTGFGVGYRFTHWLNLRVEPKWHRFEYYYDGAEQNSTNRIVAYNTFTLGLGCYGFIQPFKKSDGFLKGIVISPSIRWWPTVSSTLSGDKFQYDNAHTGNVEEIETVDPGIGFTPLVINLGIGYTFNIK